MTTERLLRDFKNHSIDEAGHGNISDILDGEDSDAGSGRQYPIGSLIVRPGCTFYQFHETGYNGGWNVYEGPGVWTKIENGPDSVDQGCAKGRPCFMCRCSMRHIDCVPEDKYQVVMSCDATKATEDSECNYKKTVGTTFTQSYSTSMSVDVTVKYEMEAKFFDLFSEKLGVSISTGYDWNEVSSETVSEEEHFEINAIAPKGYVLKIEQAVGHCDGNVAKTELFKIQHIDPNGKVAKTQFQKMFRNGTIVILGNK